MGPPVPVTARVHTQHPRDPVSLLTNHLGCWLAFRHVYDSGRTGGGLQRGHVPDEARDDGVPRAQPQHGEHGGRPHQVHVLAAPEHRRHVVPREDHVCAK
eukprot:4770523-Pyramimonas_sp.AAC.2